MVDLVKIRKKKAAEKADAGSAVSGSAGVPPAGPEASRASVPSPTAGDAPPPTQTAARDAAGPAGGTPALREAARDAAASAGEDASAPKTKLEKFKSEAGKRRAFESAKADDTAPQATLELLTFVIAGEQYAVDIERIVEIVTPRVVTRIPNADPSVVGIISLRGTIVTLVDVRRKLRHREAGAATADTRIVVIDFRHEIIGFLVDRVLRVVKSAAGDIERHPVVHVTELDDSIRGVFRANGALTILLDLDKLLDHGALAARTA
jgi:purine-binding chemotaxis protein CheW